jgi:hypothetical protein
LGFKTQAKTIARSAAVTKDADAARAKCIDDRRNMLNKLNDDLHTRLYTPSSPHNYGDRWWRLVRLLKQDIVVAYQKLAAAHIGGRRLYGWGRPDFANVRDLPRPWRAEENQSHNNIGFLDDLVVWVREALNYIDTQRQFEIDTDIVIPFVSPFSGTSYGLVPALFERRKFWEIIRGNRLFNFSLKTAESGAGAFEGFATLRLRSIALAFSHAWVTSGWDDPENQPEYNRFRLRIERMRECQRLLTCTSWVLLPDQMGDDGRPINLRPIRLLLGRVSNLEALIPPSAQKAPGVDPRGDWSIQLSLPMIQSNDGSISFDHLDGPDWLTSDTIHFATGPRIWDLKLILRVTGIPSTSSHH